MSPTVPFWFKQRQCKAEPQGEKMLRATGPNLAEAFLHVQQVDGRWAAGLRTTPDGTDLASTQPEVNSLQEAWNAAFELYRVHVIC